MSERAREVETQTVRESLSGRETKREKKRRKTADLKRQRRKNIERER